MFSIFSRFCMRERGIVLIFLFFVSFNTLNFYKAEEWCRVSTNGAESKYEQCLPEDSSYTTYVIDIIPLISEDIYLTEDIIIKLNGTGKQTKPITIVTQDGTITRLSVDRIDVGDLTSIDINLSESNWGCEKITVFKGSKFWVFDCSPSGDLNSDDKTTRFLLSGNRIYTLSIQTGIQKDAGTNGTIGLTLIGSNGKTNEKKLSNSFDSGSYLTFQVKAADIGDLIGIVLSNDSKNSPWYCEDVRVLINDNVIKAFPIKRWIGEPYEAVIEITSEIGTSITNLSETSPIDIQCSTRAIDIYSETVTRNFNITVRCPINCQNDHLIHIEGSSLHPSSTSICASAIFDGVMSPSGGEVVVSVVKPVKKFFGGNNKEYNLFSEDYEPSADANYYSFFTFLNNSIDNIDTNVRLVDGFGMLSSFGRLEVLKNGRWGTVCKKGKSGIFDNNAARLVCNTLGFNKAIVINENCINVNNQNLCAPTGYDVSYAGITCLGNEDDINKCNLEDPSIDCKNHKDDVVIKCTNSPITNEIEYGTLRIVDATGAPSSTGTGRLEIYNNGFGSICNEFWTKTAEKIACLEMGYSGVRNGGISDRTCSDFNGINLCAPISKRIAANSFKCIGTENRLKQCFHDSNDDIYCTHDQDVIISCTGNGDPSEFRHKRRAEAFTPTMKKIGKTINLTCYDNFLSHSEFKNDIGKYVLAFCPNDCMDEPSPIKGTFIYTSDSSICKAAIHSGVIDNNGGEIVVITGINQPMFYGSSMNGITSISVSRDGDDPKMRSFMISKATKFIMSNQIKSKPKKGTHLVNPIKPASEKSTVYVPSKFTWIPDIGWKGFNGKSSDFITTKDMPGDKLIKAFKDFTFIVTLVPTGGNGKWNTIFSFQNCGGLTCVIDNFGEIILQENCKAHLLKTSYFPATGKQIHLAIMYYNLTRDLCMFVNGEMVVNETTEFDFDLQGELIIGKAGDTDSDYFIGQITSFEAYGYTISPEQIRHNMLERNNNFYEHLSKVRVTMEGNVCLSKCIKRSTIPIKDKNINVTNPAISLGCADTLHNENFNGPIGKQFLVSCTKSCIDANVPVKGSKIYTSDSSICKSALHAGVIPKEGGELIVTTLYGFASYDNCHGHFGTVISYSVYMIFRNNEPEIKRTVSEVVLGAQSTSTSTPILYRCLWFRYCTSYVPILNVLGVYSPISSLCQAAIHSGKMDNSGGEVEIEVKGKMNNFQSNNSNGILSRSSGQYLKSFSVIESTKK
ncbi:LCCL domain-containing protein [Theileria equi strain WA]|uniref:LCCL domain-containing protein n=1 Tax=Theileria equi strain WA TaxID=1537102 RepID=L0B198_THEEQ|nr:LCCL domain-containing protein [Theileria equi strain WA]AFZ81642.1 LCCL domain-containing protein [Theileria equi strain WA]|eukprot:XP_004831308.1 LCCL domain-containing protein [Theileria equi strain WA]